MLPLRIISEEVSAETQEVLPPKSQSNGLTHSTPPVVEDTDVPAPASVEHSPRRKLSNVGQTVSRQVTVYAENAPSVNSSESVN